MDIRKESSKKRHSDWNTNYRREHYDQISFYVPKGEREKVKAYCSSLGMTPSEYFNAVLAASVPDFTPIDSSRQRGVRKEEEEEDDE